MDPLLYAPYLQLESSPIKTRRPADPAVKLSLPIVQQNSPLRGRQGSYRNLCSFNAGLSDGANDYIANARPFFPISSHGNPLPNFLGNLSDRGTLALQPRKTKIVSFQDESPLEASKRKNLVALDPLPSMAKPDEINSSYKGFNTTRTEKYNTGERNSPRGSCLKNTRNSPENFTEAAKKVKFEPAANKNVSEELSPTLKEEKIKRKIKLRKLIVQEDKNIPNDQSTYISPKNRQNGEANFVSRFLRVAETSEERSKERSLNKFQADFTPTRPVREGSQIEGDPVAKAIIAHIRPQGEASKEYLLPHVPQSINKVKTGSLDLKLSKQSSLSQFLDYGGEGVPKVEVPQHHHVPSMNSNLLKQDASNESPGVRSYRLPLKSDIFRDINLTKGQYIRPPGYYEGIKNNYMAGYHNIYNSDYQN